MWDFLSASANMRSMNSKTKMTKSTLSDVDLTVSKVADKLSGFTGILCFYTSASFPEFSEPMLRIPEPEIGSLFNEEFADIMKEAISINEAVHDGAVMLGRADVSAPYQIRGWSYRLIAPFSSSETVENRGSAFNSCMAMSDVSDVDCLYLWSSGQIWRFCEGRFEFISEFPHKRSIAISTLDDSDA